MSSKIALFGLFALGCGAQPVGEPDLSMSSPDLSSTDQAGGACQPACSGLTPRCNGSGHCVGCTDDSQCAPGTFCKITSDALATCTPGCTSDDRCGGGAMKCCAMRCIDTQSDPAHCGACGMACAGAHQQAKCMAGQCAAGACDPGWGDCNKDVKDGCEVNLHADPDNCTACGAKCAIPNAFSGCADGCYTTACKFGYDDCNMNQMDGCETSVLSDKNNCGGCGKLCNALPNASALCAAGSCLLGTCNPGFGNCDNNAQNGCETNLNTDAGNCGKCGSACAQGLICKGGGCTCPNCNIPNASALCVNNNCVFDKCNPGFADCNNNLADGCEANLNNDSKNCGQCGKSCNNLVCLNQVCTSFRPNVLLCGGSGRSPATFFPQGTNFMLVSSCTPDNNTQAIFVTRGGAGQVNAQTFAAYVNNGGIVLTEYNISQTVWTAVFGVNTAQGGRFGSCTDTLPSVNQFNPNDPFWQSNVFQAQQPATTGCGYGVEGYQGITTLAGWDNTHAAVGYRVLGQGRVWATDFDWQDGEMQQPFTYTNGLMGYMMTHR